jgi:nitroreductase
MPKTVADYESLNGLMLKRRSIRKFKTDNISKEDIDKILKTAATAPVGIPPSEVKVMVFQGHKKVQELAEDLFQEIKHTQKIMTPLALGLMKIFMGNGQYKVMKDFALPLCNFIVQEREKSNDMLFYNAPIVMVFYGTELSDAEDMIIAATNATIAAESLNLGTCFIGTVGYMLNNSQNLKKKYGILKGEKVGTAFVLGIPDEKYLRTFQRNFKEVKIIN